MEKMRFESVDGFQENIRRLADIFPSCVKEQKDNDGKTIRKVDINTLQLLLGINQKESETCEFSWVGKREAVKEVYKPIRKTLRPVVQDSVEWDSTGNLYIEGDNLDVLKLLQESYLDSVKVIPDEVEQQNGAGADTSHLHGILLHFLFQYCCIYNICLAHIFNSLMFNVIPFYIIE